MTVTSSARASVPKVTIFSCTFNQRDILRQTLDTLGAVDYPADRLELVILDDGSTDGTGEALRSWQRSSPFSMRILECTHERHYMSARRWNQCVAAAGDETEVFIQIDDVLVRGDFIEQHVKWHRGDRLALVTGAKFEGPTETWELGACQRAALAGPGGAATEVGPFTAVWAASLSFSRRLMQAIWEDPHDRPYDERMEGWGFHEIELACRMQKAGAAIVYDPAAGVFHRDHTVESESIRGLERERLIDGGERANVGYLLAKHGLDALPHW